MNLLYITPFYKPAYAYGGPVRSVSLLCESLQKTGVDVSVYTTDANGSQRLEVQFGRQTNIAGVRVQYFPLSLATFFYSTALGTAIANNAANFDLVVADSLFAHGLGAAAKACRSAGIPYVVPPRGGLTVAAVSRKRLKKRAYLACFGRRWLNGATAIHCTDKQDERSVRAFGVTAPTFIVPNPIDLNRFARYTEREDRSRNGLLPGTKLICAFVGRLHPIKRPEWTLEAVARLSSLGIEVALTMAGPDETGMAAALISKARELGIPDRFSWIGELRDEEVSDLLLNVDLLLMPSESENFGIAAAEALAAGVPIVTTPGVPVGRQAEEVQAGFVSDDDLESFCRTLRRAAESRCRFSEMARNGRELVQDRFEAGIVARRMKRRYEECIRGAKSGSAVEFSSEPARELASRGGVGER